MRTLVPWRWSATRYWLDKCCIDQSSDASKQAGIAHLGDSLERSQRMFIIFSDVYLTRLWCTYELAAFCKLIKDQKERIAAAGAGDAAQSEARKSLLFLSLNWSAWWSPANLARSPDDITLSPEEEALLAGYCCRKAKFWKRDDQATVLKMIREQWGSEEDFNNYVRLELPAILLEGKQQYYAQARDAVYTSFLTLFS
jgi:hypothetical protein